MIREFIEYLYDRGREAAISDKDKILDGPDDKAIVICGTGLRRAQELLAEGKPKHGLANLQTLPALVSFLADTEFDKGKFFGLVVSPKKVKLANGIFPDGTPRLEAEVLHTADPFPLGTWQSAEDFALLLRARCETGTDQQTLLERLASVSVATVKSVSQLERSHKVVLSLGEEAEGSVALPSSVVLALRRTFPEIDQPEGEYALQVRNSGHEVELMLVDAGGGTWEYEACLRLREWLQAELDKNSIEGVGVW